MYPVPGWHWLWGHAQDSWHYHVGGPWDIITFVGCHSKNAILIHSKEHTAQMLDRVILSFGVPRRLLSDRGQEFTRQVWNELLRTLSVQRILTSPCHSESNAINECSHRTMNNMLLAYLYTDGNPILKWVDKNPVIMLALNSMPHQPHWYSASMVATGRESTRGVESESESESEVEESLTFAWSRSRSRSWWKYIRLKLLYVIFYYVKSLHNAYFTKNMWHILKKFGLKKLSTKPGN